MRVLSTQVGQCPYGSLCRSDLRISAQKAPMSILCIRIYYTLYFVCIRVLEKISGGAINH